MNITFEKPAAINTAQLVLDSDFSKEKKITLSSTRQRQQDLGVPRSLVRNFEIRLKNNGETVKTIAVTDNCHRFVRRTFDTVLCDSAEIVFTETWGDAQAKVFEIRFM